MIEPRFHAPALDVDAGELRLTGDEGHHLVRVLRLGPGARVRVFDGRGTEARADVCAVDKTGALLRVIERVAAAPESRVRLTLAPAVLKGEKMDAVIRDATMMGIAAILPLVTARTVVPGRALDSASLHTRWHRIAVASAKQCGRAVVPEILPAADLTTAPLAGWSALLVEPTALLEGAAVAPPARAPDAATLAIGPEGGWTRLEVDGAIARGWLAWSLGSMTLRADAAPLAALAVLRWLWRDPVAAP